jgi:hypothetical protein
VSFCHDSLATTPCIKGSDDVMLCFGHISYWWKQWFYWSLAAMTLASQQAKLINSDKIMVLAYLGLS